MKKIHTPVMLDEVIAAFKPTPSKVFLDCTYGRGGHAEKILSYGSTVYAADRDYGAFAYDKQFECSRFSITRARFSDKMDYPCKFDGILFDFGLSSDQIGTEEMGISFNSNSFLNMDMGMCSRSLYRLVNSETEKFIADIIYNYGNERASRKIAKAIYEYRKRKKIEYTSELVEIINKIVPKGAIQPSTKTFQAFRIYVNDELNEIINGLQQAFALLKEGGVIACISFHSLEDILVKNFGKSINVKCKALLPTRAELISNRRARSAKLRIIRR